MHVLARLVLDGVRIVLQALIMQRHALIFLLQASNLLLEPPGFMLFLPIGNQAIVPKHRIESQPKRQAAQHGGGEFAPHAEQPFWNARGVRTCARISGAALARLRGNRNQFSLQSFQDSALVPSS